MDKKISFDDWCEKLDAHHRQQREKGVFEGYGPGNITEITGRECWRDMYDDGYSPEDALAEDRDCWE